MPRAVLREPKASGSGIADARLRQDVQETIDRVLPPWLRGHRLLDNNGAGYEISSAAVLTIPHLLGRAHKGATALSVAASGALPTITTLRSDHTDFTASLAGTHVQLASDSADPATILVLVW